MRQQVAFWALLFSIQYAGAADLTATWKTPTSGDDLKANTQDSVWLDWTSNFPTPVLRMWCKNETDGGNLALASSFKVDSNGPFEYILDSFVEPYKVNFPLSCHAELARDDEDDNGVDCPVGIVWSLNADQAMKTVSQTQSVASTATSKASTTTQAQSSGTYTTGSPAQVTGSPSTTAQSTTDSPSQSTTNPTSSTDVSSNPSTGTSESDSGATTAPVASTSSSSNNTGAIVGGVIGGIAVLSFIIFGLIFLRRHKRNNAPFPPVTNESSIWNFYFFNTHRKREAKVPSGPFYEKEGSGMARELEANAAGGKANHAAPYNPVELPVSSNHYP
ncbi:hypothetical protein V491_03860 [Pseudogymnoascus sp. VKM F-3775]|nr:hypothetical protein V491_03860 [Pseudogymnoascus sp. VKM F-3775]